MGIDKEGNTHYMNLLKGLKDFCDKNNVVYKFRNSNKPIPNTNKMDSKYYCDLEYKKKERTEGYIFKENLYKNINK